MTDTPTTERAVDFAYLSAEDIDTTVRRMARPTTPAQCALYQQALDAESRLATLLDVEGTDEADLRLAESEAIAAILTYGRAVGTATGLATPDA